MRIKLDWILMAFAAGAGYAAYGWPGVVLAITLIVFWLLLQLSRGLRVLRFAAKSPVGSVASAIMLHAKLKEGMSLTQIIKLTGSLGKKLGDNPETFAWADGGGDEISVQLHDGRLTHWEIKRLQDAEPPA